MVLQARIQWSATTGAVGGESVFAFADSAPTGIVRSKLVSFIDMWAAAASDQWSASVDTEIRYMDTATGQLTAVGSITAYSAPGTVVGEAVADATCGLVRYSTAGIVNGHRVRGRTFVPGYHSAHVVDGQWDSVVTSNLEQLGSILDAELTFSVWARPLYVGVGGSRVLQRPGSLHTVTGHSAWSQCAVLRHRRQR